MTTVIQGTGATITFQSSGYSADIVSISAPQLARGNNDTAALHTESAKTSEPDRLYDPGEWSIEFVHDPEQPLMVTEDIETIVFTYPDGTTTRAFNGFVTNQGGGEFSNDSRVTTKINVRVAEAAEVTPPAVVFQVHLQNKIQPTWLDNADDEIDIWYNKGTHGSFSDSTPVPLNLRPFSDGSPLAGFQRVIFGQGRSSYANVPNLIENPDTWFCICLLRTTAIGPGNQMLCAHRDGGSATPLIQFGILSDGRLFCQLRDSGSVNLITGSTNLQPNTEYALALAVDRNGDQRLYINDQIDGTGSFVKAGSLASPRMSVGGFFGSIGSNTFMSDFAQGTNEDISDDEMKTRINYLISLNQQIGPTPDIELNALYQKWTTSGSMITDWFNDQSSPDVYNNAINGPTLDGVQLNGNDVVTITPDEFLSNNAVTVTDPEFVFASFLVRPHVVAGDQVIYSHAEALLPNGVPLLFFGLFGSNARFTLRPNGQSGLDVVDGGTLNANEWVILSYMNSPDESEQRVYINDQIVATGTFDYTGNNFISSRAQLSGNGDIGFPFRRFDGDFAVGKLWFRTTANKLTDQDMLDAIAQIQAEWGPIV